jgi:hypothetical protein
VELRLRGTQSWSTNVAEENPYTLRPFALLDPTARDSDGDGVRDGDGADDETDAAIGDVLPFLNGAEPDPLTWTGDVWDRQPGDPDA